MADIQTLPKYYSIMECAAQLHLTYFQARDYLLKRGAMECLGGKSRVSEENLKLMLSEFKLALNVPKLTFDPYAIPPIPQGAYLVPKKTLIANLPLVSDMVYTAEHLEGCLIHGRWRNKSVSRTPRYVFQDFRELASWASPIENNAAEMQRHIFQALQKEKKPERKAAIDKLLQIAVGWNNVLREDRLGYKRAVKTMTPSIFRQDYEGAKERFYAQPWNRNKEIQALFPPDFKVL